MVSGWLCNLKQIIIFPCELWVSQHNLIYFCLYFSARPWLPRYIHVTISYITGTLKKGFPSILPAAPAISSVALSGYAISNAKSWKNKSGQAGRLSEGWGREQSSLAFTNLVACFAAGARQGWGGRATAGHCWTIGPLKDPVKVECGDWRCEARVPSPLSQSHWNMCEIGLKHATNMSSLCRECLEEGSLC